MIGNVIIANVLMRPYDVTHSCVCGPVSRGYNAIQIRYPRACKWGNIWFAFEGSLYMRLDNKRLSGKAHQSN